MKKTLNLAHRGFSGKYPENTRCAFMAAIKEGNCDGFESDVHLSADGELVVIHDPVLERTTNGTGAVLDHTFKELRKLDIGSWKGKEFSDQRIMHFEELIDLIIEHNLVLNLEVKNYEVFYKNIEEKIIDTVIKMNAQERVFISSFNHQSMLKFRNLLDNSNNNIKLGLLYGYPMIDIQDYAKKYNMDAIHPRITCINYSQDLVKKAHDAGLGVHTWTVNSEEDMKLALNLGVDSIITNYPDVLDKIINKMEE